MIGQFLASAFCIVGGTICLAVFIYGLLNQKICVSNAMKFDWYSRRDDKVLYWVVMIGYLAAGLFFMVMGIGFALHEPAGESCAANCVIDR